MRYVTNLVGNQARSLLFVEGSTSSNRHTSEICRASHSVTDNLESLKMLILAFMISERELDAENVGDSPDLSEQYYRSVDSIISYNISQGLG